MAERSRRYVTLKVRLLFAVFAFLFSSVRQISAQLLMFTAVPINFLATVTAYSSTRRQISRHPTITASGKRVANGIVACPRKFPFGTKVSIDGKTYTCQDRLNKKYDDRFDIWKPSTAAARIFGKRKLPVVITEFPQDAVEVELTADDHQ